MDDIHACEHNNAIGCAIVDEWIECGWQFGVAEYDVTVCHANKARDAIVNLQVATTKPRASAPLHSTRNTYIHLEYQQS
jgi:hypothetical protein